MKRSFCIQVLLTLALIFWAPLSIQANCFLAPSYWYGCGSSCSSWGGFTSYASFGGYSTGWDCAAYSYPSYCYAAYPTYSYPVYNYSCVSYPVSYGYPACTYAAPTSTWAYPGVAASYPLTYAAPSTYWVNRPAVVSPANFGTCPTTASYVYPVYQYAPVSYPTYYYPASPSYYSVPLITSSTTIVSQPSEITKVKPDSQPMHEILPTPGGKPEGKGAPGKSSAPMKDQPVYRELHRQMLVKFRTVADGPQLVKQAQEAYRLGQYAEAYDRSWAAVQLDSSNARAWFSKAASELALGQSQEATASADRAALLERLGQKGSLDSLSLESGHREFLQKAQSRLNRETTPRVAIR